MWTSAQVSVGLMLTFTEIRLRVSYLLRCIWDKYNTSNTSQRYALLFIYTSLVSQLLSDNKRLSDNRTVCAGRFHLLCSHACSLSPGNIVNINIVSWTPVSNATYHNSVKVKHFQFSFPQFILTCLPAYFVCTYLNISILTSSIGENIL